MNYEAAEKVIRFLDRRGGFDAWWEDIDRDTRQEIKDGLAELLAIAEASAQGEAGRSALTGDELVNVLTRALRTGDQAYESVGGSTRHYVRECLLPVLERMCLAVVALPPPPKAEP